MATIPFYRPQLKEINSDYLAMAYDNRSGELIEDFEKAFRKYIGSNYAVSVTNAASALHLALCALDIKRGDKIICSVNAHPSVPAVIRHFDAEPIFIDIKEDTLNLDIEALEEVLKTKKSKKLRGIIVTYIGGQTPDMDEFMTIAKRNKIFVVEDAIDAMGGSFGDRKIGNFNADISVFSFTPIIENAISTCAMLTTNNDDLFDRAVLIKNHAIERRENEYINYIYDVVDIGFDYNLNGLAAAYARTQFDNVANTLARRKSIAKRYLDELKDTPHVELPAVLYDHVFSVFIIKIDKNRDDFAKELAQKGIETDLHFIPLHMMSYYRNKYELRITSFPTALRAYQHVLALPMYATLTDDEVTTIISAVREIAENRIW